MDYKYTSIGEEQREPRQEQSWLRREKWIAVLLIVLLTNIATFGLTSLIDAAKTHTAQTLQNSHQFSCGNTVDEARRRGCTFDVLTASWLHPKCSQYGQQEFLELASASNSNNRSMSRYWSEKGGAHELGDYQSLMDLQNGSKYWTTQEAHIWHCAWMLWRIYDAAMTGKRLDAKTSSFEHTEHCIDVLAEQAVVGAGERLYDVDVSGDIHEVGWNTC